MRRPRRRWSPSVCSRPRISRSSSCRPLRARSTAGASRDRQASPAVLLRLGRRRRGLRHDGDRREHAHGLLAALPADPRGVRLGPRDHRGRLLRRLPRRHRLCPVSRDGHGPLWPARGDPHRHRDHERGPRAGAADEPAVAPARHAGRARRRRLDLHDLHRPLALPAALVRAPARARHRHRVLRRRHRLHRAVPVARPAPRRPGLALGVVGLAGIVGQIALGWLSDRVGREWAWTLGGLGFAVCYVALLLLPAHPSPGVLYLMVTSQGLLGYGLASVFGAIPAEIFQGRRYGTIFGTLNLGANAGAAFGPWVAGAIYDRTGTYTPAWLPAIGAGAASNAAIGLASRPRAR